MVPLTPMVGRAREIDALRAELDAVHEKGGILFLRGETGIGKTRLLGQARETWAGTWVHGAARPDATPYSPLREALGTDAPTDQDAWLEQLAALAGDGPAVCVLEDLHHADLATLDIVADATPSLSDLPLLLIGTYDDSGLPRDHGLRVVRAALRRAGRLQEIRVPPLTVDDVARLLTAIAGEDAARRASQVERATGGLTFFVEEVARALADAQPGSAETDLPLPESVSDAVLDSTRELRARCADALELAAVLGDVVDLGVLAGMVPPDQVDDLLDAGVLVQRSAEAAAFRHPLVGAALRDAIPWARRRRRHAEIAGSLSARDAEPSVIGGHWEAAGESERARQQFVEAARRRCAMHAYRDAAALARRALALWPREEETDARAVVMEQLADCAEKSGDPLAAVGAWHEVVALYRQAGDTLAEAHAYRRLASAAELGGDLPAAAAARAAAAERFAAAGDATAAASERIALAEHYAGRGHLRTALDHLEEARGQAERSGREELKARVLAIEGMARAALGHHEEGIRLARSGLDLALATKDAETIGANYYEFAGAMLYASRYDDSADTYRLAADYCKDKGVDGLGQVCLACMSVAVRCRGDWDRALEICRQVLADPGSHEHVRIIAQEEAGLIGVLRGGHRRGQATLRKTLALGERHGIFGVVVGSAWGLSVAASAVDGDSAGRNAVDELLARCDGVDEWHFALPALRWASSNAAALGDRDQLARCQALLVRAATHNSAPKVLSALAHASAELALLDGDPRAADQFARSAELVGIGVAPYESTLVTYRWGVAVGTAGDRSRAADLLVEAYRSARRLRAQPMAQACAAALEDLGERVDRRLGRTAVREAGEAALTRRERQVLRLLAAGRTNKAIAEDLVLSVRTVDMHVRSILGKLDCSSRTAAGRRAQELGLLAR